MQIIKTAVGIGTGRLIALVRINGMITFVYLDQVNERKENHENICK